MKKILLLSVVILSASVLFAQQPTDEELKKKGPFIRVEPSEFNMGTINSEDVDDETGRIEIEFYNDGIQPLIVTRVVGCCGTRVDEWTKEPIAPGQKGTLKAYFRVAAHPHRISRTITIQSNAVNGNSKRVAVLGEVVNPTKSNELQL